MPIPKPKNTYRSTDDVHERSWLIYRGPNNEISTRLLLWLGHRKKMSNKLLIDAPSGFYRAIEQHRPRKAKIPKLYFWFLWTDGRCASEHNSATTPSLGATHHQTNLSHLQQRPVIHLLDIGSTFLSKLVRVVCVGHWRSHFLKLIGEFFCKFQEWMA